MVYRDMPYDIIYALCTAICTMQGICIMHYARHLHMAHACTMHMAYVHCTCMAYAYMHYAWHRYIPIYHAYLYAIYTYTTYPYHVSPPYPLHHTRGYVKNMMQGTNKARGEDQTCHVEYSTSQHLRSLCSWSFPWGSPTPVMSDDVSATIPHTQ